MVLRKRLGQSPAARIVTGEGVEVMAGEFALHQHRLGRVLRQDDAGLDAATAGIDRPGVTRIAGAGDDDALHPQFAQARNTDGGTACLESAGRVQRLILEVKIGQAVLRTPMQRQDRGETFAECDDVRRVLHRQEFGIAPQTRLAGFQVFRLESLAHRDGVIAAEQRATAVTHTLQLMRRADMAAASAGEVGQKGSGGRRHVMFLLSVRFVRSNAHANVTH